MVVQAGLTVVAVRLCGLIVLKIFFVRLVIRLDSIADLLPFRYPNFGFCYCCEYRFLVRC